MEKQITLPKSIKDLRLYHLEAIADLNPKKMDVYDKLKLVVQFTGLDMETCRRVSMEQINDIINHYFGLINNHKNEGPQKNIDIKGKKFVLIKSVGEQPLAWHIDISAFSTKDASNVAAFSYLEKGMGYCEMDKHKNIINPVTPRAELFREDLGADIYIDLGFFLQKKSKAYRHAYMEIKRQRAMKKKKSNDSTGKIKSMSSTKSLDIAGMK